MEEVEVTEVEVEEVMAVAVEVMEVKWEEAVVIEEDVKEWHCIIQSVMIIVQYTDILILLNINARKNDKDETDQEFSTNGMITPP